MGPEALPTYRVETIAESRLIGRFEPSPWVRENAIAGLYLGGGRFLWGRFRRINQHAATCEFELESVMSEELLKRSTWASERHRSANGDPGSTVDNWEGD